MKLSIIIVNYNSLVYLKNCLKSLLANLKLNNFEIIIIDNCSSEEITTADLSNHEKIKLITPLKNLGFGGGNNFGAEQATGEFILLLNPDTLIIDDSIDEMLRYLERNAHIGILGPNIITEINGSPEKDHFGDFPTLKSLVTRKNQQNNQDEGEIVTTDRVTGACMMMRKSLFEKVKGFDTNFFMYFEDTDLCKKVTRLGYKNAILKDAKIVHFGGKSQNNNKRKKLVYYKSQNYFFRKHYGIISLLLLKLFRLPIKLKNTI